MPEMGLSFKERDVLNVVRVGELIHRLQSLKAVARCKKIFYICRLSERIAGNVEDRLWL